MMEHKEIQPAASEIEWVQIEADPREINPYQGRREIDNSADSEQTIKGESDDTINNLCNLLTLMFGLLISTKFLSLMLPFAPIVLRLGPWLMRPHRLNNVSPFICYQSVLLSMIPETFFLFLMGATMWILELMIGL